MLIDVAEPRERSASSARRSTTPPARPSTRARASSGSATPAAASSTGLHARAIPVPSTSPSRAFPASTSPSQGSRLRCSTQRRSSDPGELERRRADLAASYQRAIVQALVRRTREAAQRDRRGPDRRRRRRCRQLRAATRACRRCPRSARAQHRQCRHDRLGRPLHRARPVPRISWARCVRLALSRGMRCCSRCSSSRRRRPSS